MNGFIGVPLQLHEIKPSTLQLFVCLPNPLRLTAPLLRLNVSQTTVLGNTMNLEESESESFVTTDGQSASLSWNKAPIWNLRPDFYYCQTVAVLLMWGRSLCRYDESVVYNCCCHSPLQSFSGPSPWELVTIVTVSDSRLPFSSPPTTRRAKVEVFDPACQTACVLLPSADRVEDTSFQGSVSRIRCNCLCTRCPGNVNEPLRSKIGSSVSGYTIPAFRRSLPSRCLAVDAWFRLYYCSFQASCHSMNMCDSPTPADLTVSWCYTVVY
jgi:hypothetical protein